MRITIRYSSIDGYSETRHYQTLKGAHRWADEMLGDCFEIGTGYAISGDGIGKIHGNIGLEELLAKPKEPAPCICSVGICSCYLVGSRYGCTNYACRMDMLEEMKAEAEFVRRYPGIL